DTSAEQQRSLRDDVSVHARISRVVDLDRVAKEPSADLAHHVEALAALGQRVADAHEAAWRAGRVTIDVGADRQPHAERRADRHLGAHVVAELGDDHQKARAKTALHHRVVRFGRPRDVTKPGTAGDRQHHLGLLGADGYTRCHAVTAAATTTTAGLLTV